MKMKKKNDGDDDADDDDDDVDDGGDGGDERILWICLSRSISPVCAIYSTRL